jgi:hypothetical protein
MPGPGIGAVRIDAYRVKEVLGIALRPSTAPLPLRLATALLECLGRDSVAAG